MLTCLLYQPQLAPTRAKTRAPPLVLKQSFLAALFKSRGDFPLRKRFPPFLISFFVNYAAKSVFCLGGISFNRDSH
jgi:hypothetical protein